MKRAALRCSPQASMVVALGFVGACLPPARGEEADPKLGGGFRVEREKGVLAVKTAAGADVLRYQLERPADSKLSVESACYFHPIVTPSGLVATELAPPDHLHHRGAFFGWVEMHGKKDADFWGWGEHAPKDKRRIVNKDVSEVVAGSDSASFRARNEWVADGEAIVKEDLRVKVRTQGLANVLDLFYTLTPTLDLTLEQWAFSGFCVRCRKDGEIDADGPKGPVRLLDPKHTDPRSDWPAAPWYSFTIRLEAQKVLNVTVFDHPQNPPALWHNHRGLRMLNPCIVAPGRIRLEAGRPLILRYRIAIADGPLSRKLIDDLAGEWRLLRYPPELEEAQKK